MKDRCQFEETTRSCASIDHDRSMYVDRCRDCFIFPLRRCGNRPGQEFAAAGCGLMSRASTPFTTPQGLRFFDVF